jgi:hypothetical protein
VLVVVVEPSALVVVLALLVVLVVLVVLLPVVVVVAGVADGLLVVELDEVAQPLIVDVPLEIEYEPVPVGQVSPAVPGGAVADVELEPAAEAEPV